MSRYPGATWRPLTENETQRHIIPTQLIFHSAVSKGKSLYDFFESKKVVVESHFYVEEDGNVEQYMDTKVQADANYMANRRAISVESWDDGDPDHVPWNSAELYRLAEIAAWAHLEHGIPLVRAPSATSPGMGGHTDYPSWTNVPGKTCPGVIRKGQVKTIIAMAKAMVDGHIPIPPKPEDKEFVMDTASQTQLRTILQEELRTLLGNANSEEDKDKTHDSIADVRRDLRETTEQLKTISGQLSELLQKSV